MNDDTISRSALKKDFKVRLEKAKNWKENALNKGDDELVIRADATIDFICEVLMTINNAPTVERLQGDLISREALKEYKFTTQIANGVELEDIEVVPVAAIDNAPTVERPQGEWQLHGMIYYCSECGHECGESGDNFCGNCGADMRGDTEMTDKLSVGDEVEFCGKNESNRKMVITKINEYENIVWISGMDGEGSQYASKDSKYWRKTGRHFPLVETILKQMRGDRE